MDEIADELRFALSRKQISAWFQPQLDLASNTLVAAEALCRWSHPTLGQVPPSLFIALAEQFGLIDGIGEFMLNEGLDLAAELAVRMSFEISVNVSPAQLLTPQFTDNLAAAFGRLHLPLNAITVEITESLRITDLPVVVRRLDELRALGIGVSLDDFGIGHASMTQLRRLHATELKIDRSLVTDESQPTQTMLRRVVDDVHEAGLTVVAEGVETEAQLDRVRQLGCDRAQGYFIARPMPRAALRELLSAR